MTCDERYIALVSPKLSLSKRIHGGATLKGKDTLRETTHRSLTATSGRTLSLSFDFRQAICWKVCRVIRPSSRPAMTRPLRLPIIPLTDVPLQGID